MSDELSPDNQSEQPESNPSITESEQQSNVVDLANVDDLASDLIDMPDVQDHAIATYEAEQEQIAQVQASATDKRGDRFDPTQHAVDDNGEPKYTQAGYFAKKRGRKANSKLGDGKSVPHGTVAENAEKAQKHMACGVATANAIFALGQALGGEEWKPVVNEKMGVNEPAAMTNAWRDYYKAKDMEDIPAGLALSITMFSYIAPRFNAPKTQKRASTAWGKIKVWWANRKLKKHGLEVKETEEKKEEK